MSRPDPLTDDSAPRLGTARVKRGMAEMLKGGVIMDVVDAGAGEDRRGRGRGRGDGPGAGSRRHPRPGRRGPDERPGHDQGIVEAVSIPVMAKARIGHFVEAQVLQSHRRRLRRRVRGAHPADEAHHIDKWAFTVPFVCGATNLGEALRRISEGAAMIRSKGEAGTGNVVEATRHMRSIRGEIRRLARSTRPSCASRPRSCARRSSWSPRSPRPGSCRSCCSPRAASPPRPTRR